MTETGGSADDALAALNQITQVDEDGHLFIAPVIHDWAEVERRKIDTVIDLEGGLDLGVPTEPEQILYVYFHIYDDNLPNLDKLDGLADLGADLVRTGHRVLAHCGMGFNRSALVAGLILHKLGMPGPQTVERLRARRPGALFNDNFAAYLAALRTPRG